jgi:hypothetical protein
VLKVKETGASDFLQSFICESTGTSNIYDRDYNLNGQVVSGTGRFAKIVPSNSNVSRVDSSSLR